jgi:hypothetical protein
MLPGFGFAVTGAVTYEGDRYLKSTENTLIPASAASIASRISSFEGVELGNDIGSAGMVGWVNASSSSVYNEPRITKKSKMDAVARYSVVFVTEQLVVGKKTFARIGDNRYVNRADLRVMRLVAPPSNLMPEERWIDVDIDEQILTAYEGERPVFATLISSGRRGPSATVKGEYRIWAKVAAIAMDNSDDETEPLDMDVDGVPGEPRLYSLRHVPWTQFFHKAYALHGVYWHDRFGNRRSHGCINLSPKDARRLYDWTDPSTPPGFWSMHSTANEKGTLIRIR